MIKTTSKIKVKNIADMYKLIDDASAESIEREILKN
jgi:hypothetical protein